MAKKKSESDPAAQQAELPLLSFQGMCNTWETDNFGHMNVRFYVNRAYQGWAPFAAAIGLPHAFQADAVSTLRPRDIHIRFHREIRPGDLMNMRAGILSVTDDTVTLYQEARKTFSDGGLTATIVTVLEHVESKRGKPFAWSKKVRDSFAPLMIDSLPDHAAPKSVFIKPASGEASLARVNELNVPIAGLFMLQAHECDMFGRMLPEILLARQSDCAAIIINRAMRDQAMPHTVVDGRKIKFGVAMVECRMHFNTWPEVGDMLQVHVGLAESKPKTMRHVNWTLDPTTGESWGGLEAVAAHFDMEARKSEARSPEFLALLDPLVVRNFQV